MAMDYKTINLLNDFWYQKIYCNIQCFMSNAQTSFSDYLILTNKNRYIFSSFIIYKDGYCYNTEDFLKKIKSYCIYFINSTEPSKDGLIHIYYTFPEDDIYLDVRPDVWMENGRVCSHCTTTILAKDYEKAIHFHKQFDSYIKRELQLDSGLGFVSSDKK